MRLKVIGGPRDGQWVNIKDDVPYIKLTEPVRSPMLEPIDLTVNPIDVNTMVRYTVYTKRVLYCGGTTKPHVLLYFLAPEDWTDAKAIEHQFSK